jgi:fatty acid elongase 3
MEQFDWNTHSDSYWMSHWSTPVIWSGVYLLFILCANANINSSTRRSISTFANSSTIFHSFSILHNTFLIIFSSVICIGFLYDFIHYINLKGFQYIFCPPVIDEQILIKGRIFYWSYLYYCSKYYELMDTILIAVKGKTIIPLHAYHHLIMLPTMWLCFNGNLIASLFGLCLLNSFVHIVMYTFYLCSVLGISWSPYWKRWVTKLQIMQFVIGAVGGTSFLFFYIQRPSFTKFTFTFVRGCAGNSTSILLTFLVNVSFLVLFTRFFQNRYSNEEVIKKSV